MRLAPPTYSSSKRVTLAEAAGWLACRGAAASGLLSIPRRRGQLAPPVLRDGDGDGGGGGLGLRPLVLYGEQGSTLQEHPPIYTGAQLFQDGLVHVTSFFYKNFNSFFFLKVKKTFI